MIKLLKLGAVTSVLLSSSMTISCARVSKEITTITFDAAYESIDQDLIDTKLGLEKFDGKEILVVILNVNGEDVRKYGYLDKNTIIIPGQEELVNIADWVKYIVAQTPSGDSDA